MNLKKILSFCANQWFENKYWQIININNCHNRISIAVMNEIKRNSRKMITTVRASTTLFEKCFEKKHLLIVLNIRKMIYCLSLSARFEIFWKQTQWWNHRFCCVKNQHQRIIRRHHHSRQPKKFKHLIDRCSCLSVVYRSFIIFC